MSTGISAFAARSATPSTMARATLLRAVRVGSEALEPELRPKMNTAPDTDNVSIVQLCTLNVVPLTKLPLLLPKSLTE